MASAKQNNPDAREVGTTGTIALKTPRVRCVSRAVILAGSKSRQLRLRNETWVRPGNVCLGSPRRRLTDPPGPERAAGQFAAECRQSERWA